MPPPTPCDVEVGGNTVRGEYPLWEVRLADQDVRIELDFRNLTPGWSRGTGRC